MYTKNRYSIKAMIVWTRWDTFLFILFATAVTAMYHLLWLRWLQLPWLPLALIGTAVAFMIGFQNNATYGRIWEARKIWGGIVNTSRTWGMMIKDVVTNEYCSNPASQDELSELKKTLVYRHIAWLTGLRHAMRQKRPWEEFLLAKTNQEWYDNMHIPERDNTLEDELRPLISQHELEHVLKKTNQSAAILWLQSKQIRELKERGLIWEFSFLQLEGLLKELFDLQGKSERIKNFPYPRQYATLNNYFLWIFIIMLPFGVIPEFAKMGDQLVDTFPLIGSLFVWAAIPFSAIVSWVFHTMERIGRTGENPFEGSSNDVPISTMARGIEIDLREMLDEDPENIPDPLPSVYDVQM